MKVSILIPQLFYDLIGRVIPGAILIFCTLIVYGYPNGHLYPKTFTHTFNSYSFWILGYILFSYFLGTLLGGLWFLLDQFDLLRGKKRMDERFNNAAQKAPNKYHVTMMEALDSTERISLMYDYVQLSAPRAAARIAKLRAEQLMSGVLMIGFLILACLSSLWISSHDRLYVVLVLGMASLFSGMSAYHLEKRATNALFFSWYLVWSDIAKEK